MMEPVVTIESAVFSVDGEYYEIYWLDGAEGFKPKSDPEENA